MKLLHILSFREREVIKMRRGINGIVYSLKDIARILRVTEERVRQIETNALRKLQHPENADEINAECDCAISILLSKGCQCGGK
jgi:RNA polymerase primary sigma factor